MFRSSKDLKIVMDEVKSIKNLLKSIDVNLKLLSNKIDVQAEENKRRCYELEGNMARNLSKMDETVRKSANSINVIVRFMAGSQNMNRIQLREILIEAGALTEHVRSTSDICLRDEPTEISNIDSSRHTREITVDSLGRQWKFAGNVSIDPINTDIPSAIITNSTIHPIPLIQNTMNQDQSSLTVNSPNISDIPNNANISDPIDTAIPSTSATNYLTRPQTSLVKNTIHQDQRSLTIKSPNISDIPKNANISDTININIPSTSATNSTMSETSSSQNTLYEHQSPSNVSNLSTPRARSENANNCTTVPNVTPYIDNTNREKEQQEREALRKKYRNKYKYLDKYKNISEKNSTPGENKNIKKSNVTDSFNNVNEPHPTRNKIKIFNNAKSNEPKSAHNFLNALKNIHPYGNAMYDDVGQVEIIYINDRDASSNCVTKPVTVFQPRVLIDLIDSNSAEIKQRLAKADTKSSQSNLSKISHETISSDKSKNTVINKIAKSDTQKSETLVKNKRRGGVMKNSHSAPPKKRASFRK